MTVWTPASPGMASGSDVNRLNPRMLPAIGDAAPTIRQPPATMPRRPTCWLVPWWWATAISAPVTIRPIRHSAVATQAEYPMTACSLVTPGIATGVESKARMSVIQGRPSEVTVRRIAVSTSSSAGWIGGQGSSGSPVSSRYAGAYPHCWAVPYVPAYRLLTGLPDEPCPPIHPALDDVLTAIRRTVTSEGRP